MYLVEIETLQLKDFIGGQIPPYAILSHRWGMEELTFKDILKNRADKSTRGYRKLLGVCQTARSYNLKYVWIDTCCIDKKSSAELSEAINSMFSWYENANVCLVYLEDVDCSTKSLERDFKDSQWFTRAWTLQELIAPCALEFYDCQWTRIGSRSAMVEQIQAVTRIPISVLGRSGPWHDSQVSCDIAQKMSWAAGREATRTEDIAYSLMGLFGVNMPLLYGEGCKAFIRLQEEIIRSSTTDLSILSRGVECSKCHLLAQHPGEFRESYSGLDLQSHYLLRNLNTPLHLTSIGLNITLKLYRWQLNQYIALIRTYLIGCRCVFRFLLLQKFTNWDHVYVVGTIEEEVADLAEFPSRTKTLTIQRKLMPIAIGDKPQTMVVKNGFTVTANNTQLSISVEFETSIDWFNSRSRLTWTNIHSKYYVAYSRMRVDFDRIGVARFRVYCEGLTLWVNAYFDFNSRPCVCIGHRPINLKSLPDLILDPESQDEEVDRYDVLKRYPIDFQVFEDDLGHEYHFFCALNDFSYSHDSSTELGIRLGLTPPRLNDRLYWGIWFDLGDSIPVSE